MKIHRVIGLSLGGAALVAAAQPASAAVVYWTNWTQRHGRQPDGWLGRRHDCPPRRHKHHGDLLG
jgi:hypothetical protein